jgi:dimethylargininase
LPGSNFADGITTSDLGAPDYRLAQQQHAQYCDVLQQLGVSVCVLPSDARYPDGCFVEDTAIVTEKGAVITNPGNPSRAGETAEIEAVLALTKMASIVATISPPGTVDGGDVLRVGNKFIIGLSKRTNAAGADQLSVVLKQLGFDAATIQIPPDVLHLKTGVSFIGGNTIIAFPSLALNEHFAGFNKIVPAENDRYAANSLLVNGTVIVPAGYAGVGQSIEALGIQVIETSMTEFQKMDGGLTCLSLLL